MGARIRSTLSFLLVHVVWGALKRNGMCWRYWLVFQLVITVSYFLRFFKSLMAESCKSFSLLAIPQVPSVFRGRECHGDRLVFSGSARKRRVMQGSPVPCRIAPRGLSRSAMPGITALTTCSWVSGPIPTSSPSVLVVLPSFTIPRIPNIFSRFLGVLKP